MRLVEPTTIPSRDLPLIVFSENTSGLLEFLINWRTKGEWNHVMWIIELGMVASQGNTYSEVPISRYLKKNGRLKFVKVFNLSDSEKLIIRDSILKKLKLPWYKKMYDWLGIVGQAVGIEWINTPWLEYCSEDVPQHLKYLAKFMRDNDQLKSIIEAIPQHTNPQELNEYFQKYPLFFSVYGEWDSDLITNKKGGSDEKRTIGDDLAIGI